MGCGLETGMEELEQIMAQLQKFADDRDWDQFHSPKALSMVLRVEATKFLTEAQSVNLSPYHAHMPLMNLHVCKSTYFV